MKSKFLLTISTLFFSFSIYAVTETQLQEILIKLGGNAKLILKDDPKLDAATTGYKIFVNKKTSRTWTIDEAAWTLGHELGHRKAKGNKWLKELQADYFGFMYARQAGYNACKGIQRIKTWHPDPDHPDPQYRYNMLRKFC